MVLVEGVDIPLDFGDPAIQAGLIGRDREFPVDASGVYRVSGHGRDQGRTVPWSLILKVAASSAHGGDPDGGAREWYAYQSGLLGDIPGGLVVPRCLGTVAQPDGAFWTWLEKISDTHWPHWPLARYGLAARHLGQFKGPYLTGRSIPSWPWLSTGWLRGWVAQRAPEIATLRQHRERHRVTTIASQILPAKHAVRPAQRHACRTCVL